MRYLWTLSKQSLAIAVVTLLSSSMVAKAETASEIYTKRIVPLLQSSQPASCSECHLRGVELKDFLSEDSAQSFAELRARDWIDIEFPEKSKLLQFVARAPAQGDPLLAKVLPSPSA